MSNSLLRSTSKQLYTVLYLPAILSEARHRSAGRYSWEVLEIVQRYLSGATMLDVVEAYC
jgi:hypothetical protein